MNNLSDLEDRIDDLENEIDEIKNKMITWSGLFWFCVGVLIVALWGDKIWEGIKFVFFLVLGLIVNLFNK